MFTSDAAFKEHFYWRILQGSLYFINILHQVFILVITKAHLKVFKRQIVENKKQKKIIKNLLEIEKV